MEKQTFTTVIKPKSGWFDLHLKEVFAYRDLIFPLLSATLCQNISRQS